MKTVTICTFFLINSYLFAQSKKGILLGYHESIHASKNGVSFRLSPQVGYFLRQKWLIGASVSLDFCYVRPLLKGRIETLPINKTPYLKLGINYHWKVKNNLKEVN